nr:MAG TPA: hypothetical protein [Caudoviricetes sp.]
MQNRVLTGLNHLVDTRLMILVTLCWLKISHTD